MSHELVKFHPDSQHEYDPQFLKEFNTAAGYDRAMWGRGRGLADEPYLPWDACGAVVKKAVESSHGSQNFWWQGVGGGERETVGSGSGQDEPKA